MVKIEFDDDDGCITQETSARLKSAFKDYYAENGVPTTAEDISSPELRQLAKTYQEEFGESADEYERDHVPVSGGMRH
jgi:hypothetical protein